MSHDPLRRSILNEFGNELAEVSLEDGPFRSALVQLHDALPRRHSVGLQCNGALIGCKALRNLAKLLIPGRVRIASEDDKTSIRNANDAVGLVVLAVLA